jgi:N-methylhydantoinase A
LHGSTVATNAILEGKGATTGLLTTAGFQYALEIGRHDILRRANLYAWIKPARPVPPRRIRKAKKRLLPDGTIDTPLDAATCRDVARQLCNMGVETIAIVFLHTYTNPVHKQQATASVQAMCPQIQIFLSSYALPVFLEYERTMATVLNASLQPLVSRYISRLATSLHTHGLQAPLLIIQSDGGIWGPQTAAQQPAHLALWGPAAGTIGASSIGRLAATLRPFRSTWGAPAPMFASSGRVVRP